MSHIVRSIDVHAPIERVYGQWARFEEYPRFVEGVEAVTRLPGERLCWVSSLSGQRREWVATLADIVPGRRIAWAAEGGVGETALLTFERLGPWSTRITVRLDWNPGAFGPFADAMPKAVEGRMERALESFKGFIEVHGHAGPRRMMGQLAPLH
jgi:uncharacterized membrane protein